MLEVRRPGIGRGMPERVGKGGLGQDRSEVQIIGQQMGGQDKDCSRSRVCNKRS